MKILFELFITFFKIGLFTFGGGYAMIPLIEKEVVDNKKWVLKDDIYNYFAISQSFPGAIAINSSTLIGYKIKGVAGAIISTLGVILPSYIIITIIAMTFTYFINNNYVKSVFLGINAAVIFLLLTASIKLTKSSVKSYFSVFILIMSFIFMLIRINPIFIIMSAIIIGIIKYLGEKK